MPTDDELSIDEYVKRRRDFEKVVCFLVISWRETGMDKGFVCATLNDALDKLWPEVE